MEILQRWLSWSTVIIARVCKVSREQVSDRENKFVLFKKWFCYTACVYHVYSFAFDLPQLFFCCCEETPLNKATCTRKLSLGLMVPPRFICVFPKICHLERDNHSLLFLICECINPFQVLWTYLGILQIKRL